MQNKDLTVQYILELLKKKDASSYDIAKRFIDVIDEKNSDINGFLFFDKERASQEARKMDEAQDYQDGRLRGVPYAVKDNILVEGMRTTAGSKMLETYVAPYDATAIQAMKEEGAVILGKTNMDEFAMGSSTESSAFGATKNPHDITRVPGGSSGGSAAVVASGMAPFALGSDTGGSIRQPASFCGVVGYKPSYGLVSRHGLLAMASSLDQIGLFANTVADIQIIARFLIQQDPFDSTTEQLETNRVDKKKFRVGIVKEHFGEGLNPDTKKKITEAIEVYKKAGVEVVDVDLKHTRHSLATYYIISCAEISSNMARFDGIRYGFNSTKDSIMEEYLATRSEGFGKEVKRRIMLGTYVLSSGYYDAYYHHASSIRKMIMKDYQEAFEKVDAILCPTTPDVAFKIGEKTDDPLQMYLEDIYTVGVNLAELPAISIPVGSIERDGSTLPVGMQIVGSKFEDAKVLEIASVYENNT